MVALLKFMWQLCSDGLKPVAAAVACLWIIVTRVMVKSLAISSIARSTFAYESAADDVSGIVIEQRNSGNVAMALLTMLLYLPLSAQAIIISSTSTVSSSVGSFAVTVDVDATINTSANIDFYRYVSTNVSGVNGEYFTASLCDSGSGFVAMGSPTTIMNASINIPATLPMLKADVFKSGETLFVRIDDFDKNVNNTVVDTVDINVSVANTADTENIRLVETGTNTGIFTGYIKLALTASANDCVLSVATNSQVVANYLDNVDGSGPILLNILVDPYGLVFSSSDGAPIDGLQVTMINVNTGLPAEVFGDDGVSLYPATVITGQNVTDMGGTLYTYPSGNYRFPFVAPGNYRLEVVVPASYAMPSVMTDADLQLLPGAPFSLIQGSRGESFSVVAGPALNIDIPVDPPSLILFVAKRTTKTRASIGEYIPYNIQLTNNSLSNVANVTLTDVLPTGMRYQAGSVTVDNSPVAEPVISSDGRTLQFNFSQLSAISTTNIHYVTKVSANAKMGKVKNTAMATSLSGLTSNTAAASVEIWDDLMRSKSYIAGRVLLDSCGDNGSISVAKSPGVAGIRLFMEDGRYVDSDAEGLYHFESVSPGNHIVQLDVDSIPENMELASCETNTRFAGTPHSQFVDVKGGLLWRANFYLKRKPIPVSNAATAIQLQSSLDKVRGEVKYRVILHGTEIQAKNRQLRVNLPEDLVFVSGSASIDGVQVDDPDKVDNQLTFKLQNCSTEEWRNTLTFITQINNITGDNLSSWASMTFDTESNGQQQTPRAENILQYSIYGADRVVYRTEYSGHALDMSVPEKHRLDTVIRYLKNRTIAHIRIAAYTDNQGIAGVLRQTFKENSELSQMRARQVRDILLESLDINPQLIEITGLRDKGLMSVSDGKERGENNRHLAIYVQLSKQDDSKMVDKVIADSGVKVEKVQDAISKKADKKVAMRKQASSSSKKKQGILSINNGQNNSASVRAIRIRLDSRLIPILLLDQQEISKDRIGFTKVDKDSGTTLYSYVGVSMGQPGTHYLSLVGKGPFGNNRFTQQIEYLQTGEIADIRVLPVAGNIADGKTPLKIKLQLLDSKGDVIRSNVGLRYSGGELKPYEQASKIPQLDNKDIEIVNVDSEGLVRFAPVASSGNYTVALEYNDITVNAEVYAKPHFRDWIMVGLVEGTIGYNTVSGNKQNLAASDIEDEYYNEGRVSFYAKGKILGKYLLTAAYDSKKPSQNGGASLFGNVDPNRYYTLYGDDTDVQYDAASSKKLYIKIESDSYYAMYGDYSTGLSVTELSKYNRRMTGLKGEYKVGKVSIKGFAADTDHAFIKDEILGDGTSGLYYLSRKKVVLNSEKIIIETRDRFHSEKIIASRKLNQFIDYNLDPEDGTIYFKAPVYRHDGDFNPVYIIAEYEVQNDAQQAIVAGVRASVALPQPGSEAGVSIVSDSTPGAKAELMGADVVYQLKESTRLRAEYATTSKTTNGIDSNGDAYLLEITHKKDSVDSKVYVRQQQGDFSIGQQNNSESATRKTGADFGVKLTEKVTGRVELSQEKNLATGSTREVINLISDYIEDSFSVSAGLQHAQDKYTDGTELQSDLLTAGVKRSFLEKRLNINANVSTEASISENANSDYPTRIIAGGDYQINQSSSVFVNQEHTIGDLQDSDTTRIGIRNSPWSNAVVQSSVEEQRTESGVRIFATTGLTQRVQLTEALLFDVGLDRTETIRHPGAAPINVNVPLSSGTVSDDFTALTSGVTYTQSLWSMTSRAEYRNGEQYDKFGLLLGLYHERSPAFGLSYAVRHFETKRRSGDISKNSSLTFSAAYRPLVSPWMVFNKLSLNNVENTVASVNSKTAKIVNNLTANYLYNRENQLAFHHGIKHITDHISGTQYSGITHLLDAEYRHDVNRSWDIGVQAGVLYSEAGSNYTDSFGMSVGTTVMKNLWLSAGYNFSGFEDSDFSTAGYTAQGVYLKFRFSFDHFVVRESMAWWEKRAKRLQAER